MATEIHSSGSRSSFARTVFGVVLIGLGVAMVIPGTMLIWLGGSVYYGMAGAMLVCSGALVLRARALGAWCYALFLVTTLCWSFYEVGFDGWALVPRLGGPLVVGIGFLVPAVRNAVGMSPLSTIQWAGCGLAISTVVGVLVFTVAQREPEILPWVQRSVTGIPDGEWRAYGQDAGGTRFSPLTDITPANVAKLKPLWQTRTGIPPRMQHFVLEGTPLMIGDTLYACTGNNDVLALDPDTGKQRWRFLAHLDPTSVVLGVCRGISYVETPADAVCPHRIILGTLDARLIALNPVTGRPCSSFGAKGTVDLKQGLGPTVPGYYYVTSPPAIVAGKIVVGAGVLDNQTVDAPSGVVRAFDATTGALSWAWDMNRTDTGPLKPGETYSRGSPNVWAPISADEQLGLVYLPVGNRSPDYYGANRTQAENRYSSAVVALDAADGRVRWSFQTTHLDLWDYDVASQPTLVDIGTGAGARPALIQPTKRGEVFVLDRRTGEPIHAVEEHRVPSSLVPNIAVAPTQPFSTGMPSFGVPELREADMWGISPLDQLWCRIAFRKARYEGPMTPVGLTPTIVAPGYFGGIDWGGVSVNPRTQIAIVNSNRMANYNNLIPRQEADRLGLRPADPRLGGDNAGPGAQAGTPYAVSVAPFLSPIGVPCQRPPFGLLSAVDLRTGRLLWQHPFGTARGNGPLGLPSHLPIPMGVPNIGGSLSTASDLTFIAASTDGYFRAIDTRNGRELWRTLLPAGGQATPMTFRSPRSGRQIVVIMAGGHHYLGTPPGDYILAYALPGQD